MSRDALEEHPERFRELFTYPDFISQRGNRTFQDKPDGLRKALQIDDGVFEEASLSASQTSTPSVWSSDDGPIARRGRFVVESCRK